RNRKCDQVQELGWIALVIVDRTNHIRPREELTRAIVVVFEIVVEVKRLTGLYGDNAIQTPSVPEHLESRVRRVRKFINEVPGKALANVKIGVAAIEFDRCLAVVRLRC